MTPTRSRDFDSEMGLFSEEEPGRKGEILDAAATIFAESGYTGGSMREIAKRVGVSEPALYRHFPSKEAIFLTMVRLGAGRLRGEAMELIRGLGPRDLRTQLIALFVDRRQAIRRYSVLPRAVMPAVARNPAFLGEVRASLVEPVRAALTEKVAELDDALGLPADAGTTRDARVRALIALFVGSFVSSTVLGDEPDEAVADAALRIMGWSEPG